MKTVIAAISTLVMSASLLLPATISHADPPSPAQEFSKLFKEYGPVSGGMRDATTDLERKQAVDQLADYPPKFLDLAEKYSTDPISPRALREAIQALGSTDSAAQIAWETNHADFPTATDAKRSAARTVTLLLRDHVLSADIGPIIDRLRHSYRLETAEFLEAVLEKNPHRDMRGIACLSLARYYNDRLRAVRLADDRPDLAKRYQLVFGPDYLPAMRRMVNADLTKNIEELFERSLREFADVQMPHGGAAGKQAKSELHGIRHLAVGLKAPNIVGRDQDGTEFQLGDYRDKVLLLYFWMEI